MKGSVAPAAGPFFCGAPSMNVVFQGIVGREGADAGKKGASRSLARFNSPLGKNWETQHNGGHA